MNFKTFSSHPRIKPLQELLCLVYNLQNKIQESKPTVSKFALPKFGLDGDLGNETLNALANVLSDPGIKKLDTINHNTQQKLLDLFSVFVDSPKELIDNRKIANDERRQHLRSPRQTFDIVWHQTDCEMGEKPSRYVDSTAHFFVTSQGKIIQLHDIEWLTHHAHALNENTIGLEIEGMFLGVEGDLKTWPKYHSVAGRKPQGLTKEQIEACFVLVQYLKDYIEKRGGSLGVFYAHRQGSNTRDRDPGSLIWKEIVLPIAERFKIEVPFAKVFGKGKPIPSEWDGRSTFDY